jgi:hypothetical protein
MFRLLIAMAAVQVGACETFRRHGAMEQRLDKHVRAPRPEEYLAPG